MLYPGNLREVKIRNISKPPLGSFGEVWGAPPISEPIDAVVRRHLGFHRTWFAEPVWPGQTVDRSGNWWNPTRGLEPSRLKITASCDTYGSQAPELHAVISIPLL